jgi:hypothetical protein
MEKRVRPSSRAEVFYALRAKSLIKYMRESKELSYKDLARRLEAEGVHMDVQALINRVNGGRFSFAFALQLLSVMGADHIDVPHLSGKSVSKP